MVLDVADDEDDDNDDADGDKADSDGHSEDGPRKLVYACVTRKGHCVLACLRVHVRALPPNRLRLRALALALVLAHALCARACAYACLRACEGGAHPSVRR